MRSARWPLVAFSTVSLSLSACSHFSKNQPPVTETIGDKGAGPEGVAGEGVPLGGGTGTLVSKEGDSARRCVADSECATGERYDSGRCVMGGRDACATLPVVHFGFDQFDLAGEALEAEHQLASCLKSRGLSAATIEGFADERGANEYNVALSYKRAQTLRSALVRDGVAIPMNVVAWGEAFPAATGHDEASWAENRRAVATPANELLADGRKRAASR